MTNDEKFIEEFKKHGWLLPSVVDMAFIEDGIRYVAAYNIFRDIAAFRADAMFLGQHITASYGLDLPNDYLNKYFGPMDMEKFKSIARENILNSAFNYCCEEHRSFIR